MGGHRGAILAGMKKECQNPKEIQGKQTLFVVNLEPMRIFGEIFEGMLFDLGYEDGIIAVLASGLLLTGIISYHEHVRDGP